MDTLTTSSPFATSQSALAVTLSGGSGSAAEGTVDTDGSGNISAFNLVTPGINYQVGDIITVDEDAGTGLGTFRVASVA